MAQPLHQAIGFIPFSTDGLTVTLTVGCNAVGTGECGAMAPAAKRWARYVTLPTAVPGQLTCDETVHAASQPTVKVTVEPIGE